MLVIAALGAIVAAEAGVDDVQATVVSVGDPQVEQGQYFRGDLTASTGELRLVAAERNPRVTALRSHDHVGLEATLDHPAGTHYEVTATQPMIDDPKGRFGTWGVWAWTGGTTAGAGSARPSYLQLARRSRSSRWPTSAPVGRSSPGAYRCTR